MSRGAMEGTALATLVKMAMPLCRRAQRQCPRNGPGRPPDYEDWRMAVLIMVATLKKRKSKSAQYRYLQAHRGELKRLLGMDAFPARSTYCERHKRAYQLFAIAIELQGEKAIDEGVVEATTTAVDKCLLTARGPIWHASDRREGWVPEGLRGVDRDSDFGFSAHHGWVQGYSYEVVVTAGKQGQSVFPLLASAGRASVSEHASFADKIDRLPGSTRYVLADTGYDNLQFTARIEYDRQGRRTGRRFLCPANPRGTGARTADEVESALTDPTVAQRRRIQRLRYLETTPGRRRYARRGQTVEPFNEWFKSLFDLTDRVWHRGLANNRTMILAAIFGYQLLVRYNHHHGRLNAQIQWILDTL